MRTLYGRNKGGNVNLRKEFDKIIYGDNNNVPHGLPMIVRKFRRDENMKKVTCSCYNEQTREGSESCPYCFSEGYLWDEAWTIGRWVYLSTNAGLGNVYRPMPPGVMRADQKLFFMRYDTDVNVGDKLIEVKLDTEGKVSYPIKRISIYQIHTLVDERGESGRVEFFAAYCREEPSVRADVY